MISSCFYMVSFNRVFSASSFCMVILKSSISLILISLTNLAHLQANLQVDMVSSSFSMSGLKLAIITVLQFPPRLSLRTDVIMEFLYGTCTLVPLALSCKAIMTYSKNVRDQLMYLASVLTKVSGSCLYTLSLPARSTKCNFDVLMMSVSRSLPSKAIVNMQ